MRLFHLRSRATASERAMVRARLPLWIVSGLCLGLGLGLGLNGLTVVARGVTMSRRASNNASRNDYCSI